MLELLAPAGSPEAVTAAVQAGADAVYLGYGDFNARRNAKNFSLEELAAAVSYCHVRGAKVFLPLNPLVSDRELPAAAQVAEETGNPAGAIELPSGEVVTGKTTDLMGASSATLLNALKRLAGIDHQHHLISREAIEPIQTVKVKHLGSANPRLHSDEVLIALAISATTNPLARQALDHLAQLRDCEAHASVILSPPDSGTYAKLGMHLTCEPTYETNKLYHK